MARIAADPAFDAAMLAATPVSPALPARTASAEQARKVAVEFEAMFISQMLQPMFEGLSTDGIFGGGSAEKTYRSMMLDAYGRDIAAQGGIGLADSIVKELLKAQEGASP